MENRRNTDNMFEHEDDGWESVSNNKSRNKQGQTNHWTSPPLNVEFIPPTPANTEFEPCLYLLLGLPGSGKSTFSQALERAMPYKFARVNQDELKTRKKCEAKVKRILDDGASPRPCIIMDRCNFDAQQRKTWLEVAEEARLSVHCIHFQVSANECIRRCQNRSGHQTVLPSNAKRVVFAVQRQFKLPTQEEAIFFKTYMTIRNGDEFNDTIMMLLNSKSRKEGVSPQGQA
eukprot:CAMPEP_0117001334 /NCGR_PEP_ID=MMETSP0472-20121206/3370_1 /TAXON_ID=693140 ORGANISM="Tiarina fusus, Strain LIS" /NCGR_SAMPLE_ID=MMETSP0472 /ASSEMBLY_ACC=CAM_ASM_000603 /LENGTH=230 /DNA_ID=CAMNT_0004701311 /DNA_START=217 /DNA_END=910 /DNA_ORIENTATION=-